MIKQVKRKIALATLIVSATMVLGACDFSGFSNNANSNSNEPTSSQVSSFESSSISNNDKTSSGDSSIATVVLTEITAVSNKSSYEIGDTLDLTVTAHYSNGDTAIISEYDVTGFNNRTAGEQEVTITYGEKSTTITVTVNPAVLMNIRAINNKESYEIGDVLDLTVTATYSDETTKEVTDYDVTGYDNMTPGNQTVVVTYETKTTTVEVKVNDPVITNLTVIDNKAETGYEIGDELDLTVTAYYSNNTHYVVNDYQVVGYDKENYGTQTITVSYDGKSATVDIVVNKPTDQFPAADFASFLEDESIKSVVPTPVGYNAWTSGVDFNEDSSKYFYANTDDEVDHGEITISTSYINILKQAGWEVFTNGDDHSATKPGADAKVEFTNSDHKFSFHAYAYEEVPTKKTIASPITNSNQLKDGDVIVLGNVEYSIVANGLNDGSFEAQKCQYNNGNIVSVASNVVRFKLKKTSNGRWTLTDAKGRKLGATGIGELTWDKGSMDWIISNSGNTTLVMNNQTKYGSIYFNPQTNKVTTVSAANRKNMKQLQLFTVETVEIIYPTAITISGDTEISKGRSGKLGVTFEPENTNEKYVEWSSSNEKIAEVNQSGIVTAINLGKATITAKAFNRGEEIIATFDVSVTESKNDAWTILFYICGADLESDSSFASGDITEMLSVDNQPDDVNIVIETGGARSWHGHGISASKLGRYHIENKKLVQDELLNKTNMGLQSTLESFINWGLEEYPADKTGVVFWNHGGGLDGCCFDENYGGDGLTPLEVKNAMSNVFTTQNLNKKLEFIGYDCCLMQVADIAEFNSKYFNYMVGSEESEAGAGWDYDNWLDNLYAGEDTLSVLSEICDTFIADNNSSGGWGFWGSSGNNQTLSVLDLNESNNYFTKHEAMAAAIKNTVNSNKSTFKSVINGCKKYDGFDEGYCLIDGKDFLNKLAGNNKFSSFASTINEVKIAYGQLVAYSAKGDKAGNSNGLAFHTPILGYDYPQNQSNLTNWKALFDNL